MSFAPSQTLSPRAQDTVLGIFVIAAIILGSWLLFEDMREQRGEQILYTADLTSSYGLSQGAPVRINGVNVGRLETITLNQAGLVTLELAMEKEYASLYRQGSRLKIDSTLDIDNVLSGAAIAFIPGPSGALPNGAKLIAEEPKTLQSLMEEWDVQALTKKVGDILVNLDKIVVSVSENQGSLTASLENVANLTASMNEASQQLPEVLSQMQQTMQVMESSLREGSHALSQNMNNFSDVAKQSGALIESINAIANNMEPTVAELPETHALLNNLLIEVNGLTQQLRQHWLLQSSATEQKTTEPPANNGLFPPDESLYEPAGRPLALGEPKS